MTYNHKKASEEKYPIQVGGRMLELNSGQIGALIKKKMQGDLAVQKLFEKFEVDLDQLENLKIEIGDLDGRYAETDLKSMVLDKSLFDGGKFWETNWFVVVHELVHWLSRWKEDQAYMNDPEETLGFVGSIATELVRGTDLDALWGKIYPRIEFHFHDESDAREFFMNCIQKAKELLM